jgi:hypothetical protein
MTVDPLENLGVNKLSLLRTFPYPAVAAVTVAGGGDLPKQYYDVMDPVTGDGGGCGDHEAEGWHRRLPGQSARSDPDGEIGRLDRSDVRRAVSVLASALAGMPMRWRITARVHHARQTRARTGRGDEGDLDPVQARVPRQIRQFRPNDGVAKPVQQPYPPVIVGGAFPHGARRAVRYGEGWVPVASRAETYGNVFQTVPKFRAMLTEAGRDPVSCPVTLFGAAELLKRYRDLGAARVTAALPAAKEDVVLPILDRWAALILRTS